MSLSVSEKVEPKSVEAPSVVVLPPMSDLENVKPEAAQKVYEFLLKGRRYFGSAGASLTHQIHNPAYSDSGISKKSAQVGLDGELDTSALLRKWCESKPNIVHIDSVHIKGWGKEEVNEETGVIEGGDTDHVLIIGTEVIIIDSKRWKKKATFYIEDDGSITRNGKKFHSSRPNIGKALRMWVDYLAKADNDGNKVKVSAVICVNNEEIRVVRNVAWFKNYVFKLVEIHRLEAWLDEKYAKINDYNKTHINSSIVAQIALSAVRPYNSFEKVFSSQIIHQYLK